MIRALRVLTLFAVFASMIVGLVVLELRTQAFEGAGSGVYAATESAAPSDDG